VTTERAIEVLEEIYPSKKQIVRCVYPYVADAIDTAISALRAQQEREKGCDGCNNEQSRTDMKKLGFTSCPWCGKKLEDKA
jgi:hypothetical protein